MFYGSLGRELQVEEIGHDCLITQKQRNLRPWTDRALDQGNRHPAGTLLGSPEKDARHSGMGESDAAVWNVGMVLHLSMFVERWRNSIPLLDPMSQFSAASKERA